MDDEEEKERRKVEKMIAPKLVFIIQDEDKSYVALDSDGRVWSWTGEAKTWILMEWKFMTYSEYNEQKRKDKTDNVK